MRRDGVAGGADVEGEADRGGGSGQAAGPEPGGQSAGPGQQRDGIAQNQLAGVVSAEPGPLGISGPARSGIAGRAVAAGRAEQIGGELAEELMVDVPGDDRRDRGVAQVTRGRERAGPGPGTRQRPGQVIDIGEQDPAHPITAPGLTAAGTGLPGRPGLTASVAELVA